MSVSLSLHRKMLGIANAVGPHHSAITSWLRLTCQQQGCQLAIHPYIWTLRKERRVMRLAPRYFASIPYLASRFDYYFESMVPDLKGTDQVLDFSRVHLDTYRNPGLTFEFSAWPDEEDVMESFFHWYQPAYNDIAFDIGAHCGVSTYILSQMAGKVIAFETDSLAFALLQRNVQRHSLRNVTASKQPVVLSDAFARWRTPAYCKIDLDGGEFQLLAAAQHVLAMSQLNLAVRTTHPTFGIDNQSKIEALLQNCGFETYSNPKLGTTCARPK